MAKIKNHEVIFTYWLKPTKKEI